MVEMLGVMLFCAAMAIIASVWHYERQLDRLQLQVNQRREAYWKRINAIVQSSVEDAEVLASTRCALRHSQERNEEMRDEIDELRAKCVELAGDAGTDGSSQRARGASEPDRVVVLGRGYESEWTTSVCLRSLVPVPAGAVEADSGDGLNGFPVVLRQ